MRITILRYDPDTDTEPRQQAFELPDRGRITVLQALMYIYEHVDPTLAFSFNCRYKNCGLCAMTIDGRPRLACLTPFKDDALVEPLRNLPVLKDLVIDRSALFAALAEVHAYIPEPATPYRSEVVHVPAERAALMQCNECLSCVSACPEYTHGDARFAGPMLFVKLAQLHMDPRDVGDRRAQARQLGISLCLACQGCPCPSGIPVRTGAIAALLGEAAGR